MSSSSGPSGLKTKRPRINIDWRSRLRMIPLITQWLAYLAFSCFRFRIASLSRTFHVIPSKQLLGNETLLRSFVRCDFN